MDKSQAIELLKQSLDEIPDLRELDYHSQEFVLWHNEVQDIIKAALDSDDLKRFSSQQAIPVEGLHPHNVYKEYYLNKLSDYESALKSIIQKYEVLGIETKLTSVTDTPVSLFDKMQFHPKVIEASKSLFETGHYAQAIFEAFKSVNNFVKDKTVQSQDGKTLMAMVFNEKAPIIRLNELLNQSDIDEQEGFKFLFMGAMVGIRNPKAHESVIQSDPYRTLEYLALASLLMKRVEEGKVSKLQKGKDV